MRIENITVSLNCYCIYLQTCEVVILDDTDEPMMEGAETFAVTIASADSRSVIGDADTMLVTIDDSDLDSM